MRKSINQEQIEEEEAEAEAEQEQEQQFFFQDHCFDISLRWISQKPGASAFLLLATMQIFTKLGLAGRPQIGGF